jgi:hypothetical protein
MASSTDDLHVLGPVESMDEQVEKPEAGGSANWNLHRWLVSFRSGTGWYAIDEFIAVDANTAIERAVAIFGPSDAHQAEEIPWDAAPLPRLKAPAAGRMN